MGKKTTVGKYLIKRLEQVGITHIFGVPGDYSLKFFDLLEESSIEVIGTCNELNAGYIADAYARLNGVGAVCVTYGVGAFSLLNAVAGSYAEFVPVIAITGGPSMAARKAHEGLLHHLAGHSKHQREVYSKITVASVTLDKPDEAPSLIDNAVSDCMILKRPVFIDIPADMVHAECDAPGPFKPKFDLPVNEEAFKEALEKALLIIEKAGSVAVLAGGAFQRISKRNVLEKFLVDTGYPFSSVIPAKGMMTESLPNFTGTYGARLLGDNARKTVEESDILLVLGVLFTDFNLGMYTSKISRDNMIKVDIMSVKIGNHEYNGVFLIDFVNALRKRLKKKRTIQPPLQGHPSDALSEPFVPKVKARLKSERFWKRFNHFLEEGHVFINDAGSATLESAALYLKDGVGMLSQSIYLSIGYSLPASIGVKFAKPHLRPVVVIGDGAFQMTCQELSTIIRHAQNPVIFVLNNDGYQVERVIYDNAYNDIQPWHYSMLSEVFGGKKGLKVRTEGELENALEQARKRTDEMIFIEVCLGKLDFPPTLENLGKTLR